MMKNCWKTFQSSEEDAPKSRRTQRMRSQNATPRNHHSSSSAADDELVIVADFVSFVGEEDRFMWFKYLFS